MKAAIITIGDEILIGQINDTNSTFIAERLSSAGLVVGLKMSIGDDGEQIKNCLRHTMQNYDIVIVTGGLGPTKDDITKTTLAKIFGCKMRRDEATAEHIRSMLLKRGFKNNVLNEEQADVPECCEVLANAHGTAPGMWFETPSGGALISLAGVPFEMKNLMDDEVLPRLVNRFALKGNVHRTIITSGIPESQLALTIEDWENALPESLKLAYLPNPGSVRLRLSAYNVENKALALEQVEGEFDKLRAIIGENILGYDGASIEEILHQELIKRGKSLAVAESCTGGKIASKFTALAGASAYFMGSVTSYSNDTKRDVLGVSQSSLDKYGAVSEQVAKEMAQGVRRAMHADFGLATTGIAGPSGGSEEKPVGTVWFAVCDAQTCLTLRLVCGTDRGQIIERASTEALKLLQSVLK